MLLLGPKYLQMVMSTADFRLERVMIVLIATIGTRYDSYPP